MVKHVHIDPEHPRVVLTGVPGIPTPPDAVRAECHRCEKEVKIAPSTKRTLDEAPDLPLLCWRCAGVLLPEYAVLPSRAMGIKAGRRELGLPD